MADTVDAVKMSQVIQHAQVNVRDGIHTHTPHTHTYTCIHTYTAHTYTYTHKHIHTHCTNRHKNALEVTERLGDSLPCGCALFESGAIRVSDR